MRVTLHCIKKFKIAFVFHVFHSGISSVSASYFFKSERKEGSKLVETLDDPCGSCSFPKCSPPLACESGTPNTGSLPASCAQLRVNIIQAACALLRVGALHSLMGALYCFSGTSASL